METKSKGDLGEAMVIAECLRRGYKVAIPFGDDWRYDIIVDRGFGLDKVQIKYTESDGQVIKVRTSSRGNSIAKDGVKYVEKKYTAEEIDWLAVYDKTSNRCYFIPSHKFADGKSAFWLRLVPPGNNQKEMNWAEDYICF